MLCELHAHQTTLPSQSQPPPSLTARSQPNENADPINRANAFSLSGSNTIQRTTSQSSAACSNTEHKPSPLGDVGDDVPTEDSPETSKLKKIDALALDDALGSNQSASSVNTVLPGVALAVSADVVTVRSTNNGMHLNDAHPDASVWLVGTLDMLDNNTYMRYESDG